MSDRAVSDVVGYVLIFSTLIISVGLVGVLGTGALTDLSEHESDASAQRAMETLGTNFNDLQSGDVARASEVRLAGGTMSVTEGPTVDVTVADDRGDEWSDSYDLGALRYDGNRRDFVYANGVVVQRSEDHSRLLRDPAFLCSEERAVVSIVRIDAERRSVSKDGSITVHGRTEATALRYPNASTSEATAATDVEVTVDSADDGAWASYFEAHPHWAWDSGSNTAQCSTETVFIRETSIDIQFLT